MFHIIIKEFKEFIREKTSLFFFLMFPVVLVFLLGNLLSSMDNAEETVGDIKIEYMLQSENPFHVIAVENFIQSLEENENLVFEKTDDLETARSLAGKDEITAVVVFDGDPMEITIYEGTSHIKNRTVGAIINGFGQTYRSIAAVMKTVPEAAGNLSEVQGDYIIQKDLGVNRTMIDYYAVSMVGMICFMSMLIGASVFVGERQDKTINRLIIAPKNRAALFLQKILGMVPQVIIQIAVIMIISVVLFHANYAATVPDNLYLFLMFFLVTIAMVSMGAVIGIIIRAHPMAVIMPVLWLMMFFGGTYSKEIDIHGLTNAMPSYQIQQAAFDLAIFGRYEKASKVILICIIILAVALVVGAFLFSRKEEER